MARSRAKRWFGFIHLWVGLITGIIIFVVSITGCIYVFRDELFDLIHSDVQVHGMHSKQATLPLTQLWQNAQKHLGDSIRINDATTYSAPERNWEFGADKRNEKAITYFGYVDYDYIVYVNPYSGAVAGVVDHKYEFFQLVKMLHWSLLLNTDYGQPVVGVSILLFLVSLISGLVIWWPKKIKHFRESLKVKWTARWRRINYDLHRALAIYALPLALIISITGLVWAFKTVQAIVYVTASLSITPPAHPAAKSVYDTIAARRSEHYLLDSTVLKAYAKYPQAHSISFFPAARKDTVATLNTYVRPDGMVYYSGISENYDQYSGKLLQTSDFSKYNRGEKLLYMNYDIHVGQILGIPGKILAFLASLICASLPVTGVMIWWGRRTVKERKKARTASV